MFEESLNSQQDRCATFILPQQDEAILFQFLFGLNQDQNEVTTWREVSIGGHILTEVTLAILFISFGMYLLLMLLLFYPRINEQLLSCCGCYWSRSISRDVITNLMARFRLQEMDGVKCTDAMTNIEHTLRSMDMKKPVLSTLAQKGDEQVF